MLMGVGKARVGEHAPSAEGDEQHGHHGHDRIEGTPLRHKALTGQYAIPRTERREGEEGVEYGTKRMDVKGGREIPMDERGPARRQSATRAGAVEKKHAGTRGKTELLMSAVTGGVRMQPSANTGHSDPKAEPKGLASQLAAVVTRLE